MQISYFFGFLPLLCWKWLFRPEFGVRSTQTLVKIYNSWSSYENILEYFLWSVFQLSFLHITIKNHAGPLCYNYPCTDSIKKIEILNEMLNNQNNLNYGLWWTSGLERQFFLDRGWGWGFESRSGLIFLTNGIRKNEA